MSESLTVEAPDPQATRSFGIRLAGLLFPGAVVALVGPLGAGKTQLVRAIAEGLDIPDPRVVSSPTFVLIQEYEARLPIYHFDVYRLNSEAEFTERMLRDWSDGQARDVQEDMMQLTLQIVAKALFDADVSGDAAEPRGSARVSP